MFDPFISSSSPHSWHDSWIGCIWNSETPFWDRSYTFWPHGGCTFVARAAVLALLSFSLLAHSASKQPHRLRIPNQVTTGCCFKNTSVTRQKKLELFVKAFHHQLFFAKITISLTRTFLCKKRGTHSSQFQSLCSTKCSSEMLQNLPYFIYIYENPKLFFPFCAILYFYADIDQGIH